MPMSARDLIGAQRVFVPELKAAIDDRAGNDATGERLIGVKADLITATAIVGNLVVFASGTQDVRPTVFGFDAVFGGGEILRCEAGLP